MAVAAPGWRSGGSATRGLRAGAGSPSYQRASPRACRPTSSGRAAARGARHTGRGSRRTTRAPGHRAMLRPGSPSPRSPKAKARGPGRRTVVARHGAAVVRPGLPRSGRPRPHPTEAGSRDLNAASARVRAGFRPRKPGDTVAARRQRRPQRAARAEMGSRGRRRPGARSAPARARWRSRKVVASAGAVWWVGTVGVRLRLSVPRVPHRGLAPVARWGRSIGGSRRLSLRPPGALCPWLGASGRQLRALGARRVRGQGAGERRDMRGWAAAEAVAEAWPAVEQPRRCSSCTYPVRDGEGSVGCLHPLPLPCALGPAATLLVMSDTSFCFPTPLFCRCLPASFPTLEKASRKSMRWVGPRQCRRRQYTRCSQAKTSKERPMATRSM